jgi:type II secretory pathway component PulF
MPSFSYVCVDDNGIELRGIAAADTEDQLADQLRRQGQYLVRSTPASQGRASLAEIQLFERITRRDIVVLTQQLATVIATGISLIEGLQDIESQLTKQKLKRIVAAVRRDVESGDALSTALARHPAVFGDLYVNIVKAGEATGKIDQALDDLVAQLEWQGELNGRIREVATYPTLVIFMLGVLTIVLVGFTIPRFLQIYAQLNAQIELPLPTRIVMAVSTLTRTYWPVMISSIITVVVSLRLWGQTESGAVQLSRATLRMPIVGELRRKIALSRFARYFAYLSQRFDLAVQRVMAGESLSRALKAVGEFPPIVIQMLALGERTGRMAKSLDDVRRYFDREVDQTIKRSLTLFGPIMLVLLAGTFVLMALAFYLPLFQMLRGIR